MKNGYHDGERLVQKMAGEEEMAERLSRVMRDRIIKGAFSFIEAQNQLIVSSINENGQIWTSLLIGQKGIIQIESDTLVHIDWTQLKSTRRDILIDNIVSNEQVGLLFIELTTRMRFRINGHAKLEGERLVIQVLESYGNCPKYIQSRSMEGIEEISPEVMTQKVGNYIGETEKNWILKADTFFVGSMSGGGRMDASHRGGNPGFVEITSDDRLKIPDYQGNSMFNTLGNFVQNPNAGLLFIDYERKATLQLTGKVELLFEQTTEKDLQNTMGTGRYWLFNPEKWLVTEGHHQIDWTLLGYSPYNPDIQN